MRPTMQINKLDQTNISTQNLKEPASILPWSAFQANPIKVNLFLTIMLTLLGYER